MWAAKNGNLGMMKWQKEKGCPLNVRTFTHAAGFGSLETLKWLKNQKCPWSELTFSYAAKHGNLQNVKWLKKKTYVVCKYDRSCSYRSPIRSHDLVKKEKMSYSYHLWPSNAWQWPNHPNHASARICRSV